MAKKQKSSSDQQRNHSQESEDSSSDDQFVQQPSQNPNLFPHSDSGSEFDSDTTPPPSTSKSIPSKPIDSSSLKRPANDNDSKRLKKKGIYESEEDSKKAVVVDSRKLFQRLWSEEDEIAILKGMVEFTSKTGKDPYRYADAFYEFVKKSLHVEASSNQLKEKIRRLKKKFENNAHRGKNGEDPNFSKPFDRETFELSKKVWGNAGGSGGVEKVVKGKSDRKVVKSPEKEVARSTDVVASKPRPELKLESRSVDLNRDVRMDVDVVTDTSSYLMEVIRVNKGVGLSELNEEVVKRGMELIGASERSELENEWKELQAAEFELSVKRVELIANHARLILEAYKSSNH